MIQDVRTLLHSAHGILGVHARDLHTRLPVPPIAPGAGALFSFSTSSFAPRPYRRRAPSCAHRSSSSPISDARALHLRAQFSAYLDARRDTRALRGVHIRILMSPPAGRAPFGRTSPLPPTPLPPTYAHLTFPPSLTRALPVLAIVPPSPSFLPLIILIPIIHPYHPSPYLSVTILLSLQVSFIRAPPSHMHPSIQIPPIANPASLFPCPLRSLFTSIHGANTLSSPQTPTRRAPLEDQYLQHLQRHLFLRHHHTQPVRHESRDAAHEGAPKAQAHH
ncbi:hypothetical protein B0H16DRAFT_1728204 [Mycena metata]|uniref:Uncharacterized protein n=1 Tax=Mycena metata TaxID=1033252 RepID=A0AAD7N224_9AGAR|nr:hypothetical protein B0H16DRAFT_1728204 [Mycena metata]